ncbi:MAG TPA: glycosyltransferase family 9 protein [Opitutaceae bacterium]|nr:glycosyltransferase family 9 protein [Opitutaceae bacterium]
MPETPTPRILVIRRRYLGDVVLLGSLFRNLRLHWPQAWLAALVESRFADVVALNPDANEALSLPSGLAEWPRFLARLRRAAFTHILDLDNTEKTALIARLSGAPVRVVLHHGGFRVKSRWAYTSAVHDPNERHESHPITDYYLRALEPLGVPIATREIRLEPRAEDVAELQRFVGASRRVLLVHPGSRSAMRVWPADRFAAIIDFAQDELEAQVVLVGGPADEAILQAIRGQVRTHLLNVPGPLSISRLAALAQLSDAVLCHDSGPMHVAAAVGTPVIAIYGSQNAALFRPTGGDHVLLRPPLPCVNCVAPSRCTPGDSYHNLCVQNVPVQSVREAVRMKLATER